MSRSLPCRPAYTRFFSTPPTWDHGFLSPESKPSCEVAPAAGRASEISKVNGSTGVRSDHRSSYDCRPSPFVRLVSHRWRPPYRIPTKSYASLSAPRRITVSTTGTGGRIGDIINFLRLGPQSRSRYHFPRTPCGNTFPAQPAHLRAAGFFNRLLRLVPNVGKYLGFAGIVTSHIEVPLGFHGARQWILAVPVWCLHRQSHAPFS